ncbi:protein Son-like [Argiope bruennichi]|uniref:protein Son-like n=1 Tax=Argiope bruennichi TaxID=94029 RepID=UPI00249599C9|nr:protein Son-like [Argiope bruennichi]
MSLFEDNLNTNCGIINVEDILANFFLKKIDMKSSKSESDSKYKKKSKHKKHKSKKHKHKSGKRCDSSERRNSNSLHFGCTSSSEEKDIKRLKKLKKLDVKDPVKFNSFLPVSLSTQNVLHSDEDFVQNGTFAKVDLPYGPSLELLLANTEVIERNAESKKQDTLSLDQNNESSSHPTGSISTSCYINPILCSESVSSSKESEDSKLIENARERMKSKEENVLNDVEMSSDKLLNISKQIVGVSELKSSDNDSIVKLELSDKKEKRSKDRSQSRSRSKSNPRKRSRSSSSQSRSRKHSTSRSRSKSNPRKRSRSKSYSSHSRSRKHSISRSRSYYGSCKERSGSRDHSKYQYSSQSNSRRSRLRNLSKRRRRSHSQSSGRRRRSRSWSYHKEYTKSKHDSKRRSRSINRRDRSRTRWKECISHRSRRECSYNDRSNKKKKSSSERESKLKTSRPNSKEKYSSSKSCKIDQAKIREIAEKNVLNMIQQGTLPEGFSIENFKKKELVSVTAGRKSVQELTDFCARLSKKENESDTDGDTNDISNLEGENDFIHHPFKLKEQTMIKLNIKNAVQIPVKTHAEKFAETAKLSSQFPVSSGNQHKQKELEWIPVVPEESKNVLKPNEIKSIIPIELTTSVGKNFAPKIMESSASATSAPLPVSNDIPSIPLPSTPNQPLLPPPLPPLTPSLPPLPTPPVPPFQLLSSNLVTQTSEVKAQCTNNTETQSPLSYPSLSLSSNLPVPTCNSVQVSCTESGRSFFKNQPVSASTSQFDFSSVFCKKFQAEQKLQGDPNNAEALKAIQDAEAAIQEWVNSCRVPGMFYGNTYVKPLPRERLGGFKDYRVKRDAFTRAAPVTEGKGMSLLKKMGWNPGEGLGKNKEGSLVPLIIDIKMDKKGLVSEGESGKNNITNAVKELQGKHPVSALMELCSKRKWKPPLYTVIKDEGPPHKKQFLFKVEVNGVDYQPVMPCSNKKDAKADAAIVCLQALKVFPP